MFSRSTYSTSCFEAGNLSGAELRRVSLVIGPKRSTLQAMLVNLDGEDDVPALQSGSHSPPRTGNADIDDNGRSFVICQHWCWSGLVVMSLCTSTNLLCVELG